MKRFLLVQLKSKFFNIQRFASDAIDVLDVGVANRSAFEMKQVLPACRYHGLDRDAAFDAQERALMQRFTLMDLETDPLASAERAAYDLVIINHVLEHVDNGIEVVGNAVACLRPGGTLYLEVPNVRSLQRAASRYSYHFHDDPTHKRLYSHEELCNAVMDAGGKVVECGAAGTPLKTLLSLPRALLALLTGRQLGHLFVHSRGAITYLVARRPASA
ncbi:MAG: class I SAM-dependent methyltransferase [Pseudomonadota bacterium]|nr:class I SAM-dependent methyltransferase [Pseudomonadota bacterium]